MLYETKPRANGFRQTIVNNLDMKAGRSRCNTAEYIHTHLHSRCCPFLESNARVFTPPLQLQLLLSCFPPRAFICEHLHPNSSLSFDLLVPSTLESCRSCVCFPSPETNVGKQPRDRSAKTVAVAQFGAEPVAGIEQTSLWREEISFRLLVSHPFARGAWLSNAFSVGHRPTAISSTWSKQIR